MSEQTACEITITETATEALENVAAEIGEPPAVVLNGGCCDGMGPVVIEQEYVGVSEEQIGTVGEFDVYTVPNRAELRSGYELTIDSKTASGVGSFSLEVPLGYRLTVEEER